MRKALLLLVVLLFLTSTVCAETSYTVKNGDNLYRISKKFKVSPSEIKEANGLESNSLKVGKKLTIPDKDKKQKNAEARKQKSEDKDQKSDKAQKSETKNKIYTVKKGDNIYRIAKKFNLSIDSLKEINDLQSNALKPGQKLLLAKKHQETEADNTREAVKTQKTEEKAQEDKTRKTDHKPNTYTVKKGDNIYRIAKKFNMSVASLKEINGIQRNAIKPGQKLILSEKPEEPQTAVSPVKAAYDQKTNPIITSAKLKEVKELSGSDNLSELGLRDRVILFAKKMLHLPYRFGGNGSVGLDCSAYVQKVYGLAGFNIPRSAREQFQYGDVIDKKELSIGDLVFFRTYASFPSHVGIYLGNNLFIHASSISKKITIDSLEAPYYFRRFIGAKRLLPEEMKADEDSDT